ncbi:MAG: recombinase family protein [Deltaproteobacteria bacterium]|nr:recombinase family protein [Deltaproteobacteria bacterium]
MRAGIYIRKSREDKSKPALRLDAQRNQLPAVAERRGWEVVVVEDDGFASGQDQARLPGLQRIIAAIKQRRLDVVLAIEHTRFSRDETARQSLEFIELCRANGVKVATPDAVYDPDEHLQWFNLYLAGGLSAVEMRQIRRRMAEGRAEARHQGRWAGGHPPLGYTLGEHGLELSKDAGRVEQVVRAALEQAASGAARATGIPVGTVRRMLRPRRLNFYAGYQDDGTGNLVRGQWPPIMDLDLVRRVLLAKSRRNARGGKSTTAAHLLTGLGILRCGHCERSMKTWKDHKKNPRTGEPYDRPTYYGCASRTEVAAECPGRKMVRAEILERRVLEDVERRLSDRAALKRAFDAYRRAADLGGGRNLEAERDASRKAKQRLVRAVAEGVISFEDARPERERLDMDLARIDEQLSEARLGPISPDLIPRAVRLDVLSFDEKREYLCACLESIRVRLPFVYLDYRFAVLGSGKTRARLEL